VTGGDFVDFPFVMMNRGFGYGAGMDDYENLA
jgi:hypothetical protein